MRLPPSPRRTVSRRSCWSWRPCAAG